MDYIRIIKLYDSHHNEVPFIKGFPNDAQYRKFRIGGANAYYAAIEGKAILLFQCIIISGMEIWICDYRIFSPVELYCLVDCEFLEFDNIIEGRISYRLEGFGWQHIESGQYNLI